MNAVQKFSKRLLEHGGAPPGIAPAKTFDPPMSRPEDWLSRLGEIARKRRAEPAAGAGARLERRARAIRQET